MTGRYPAPCPVELGLSSPRSSLAAIARLTRKIYLNTLFKIIQILNFDYIRINNNINKVITINPYKPTPQNNSAININTATIILG